MYPELFTAGRGDFTRAGIPLTDAYNVMIRKRINTVSGLSFQMPRGSSKWPLIKIEDIVKADGQLYVIKRINDGTENGRPYAKVEALHIWWEVCEKKHIPKTQFIGKSAQDIIGGAFSGLSYLSNGVRMLTDSELSALGLEPVTEPTDIETDKANPMEVLSKVIDNLYGEVYVDNFSFALVKGLGRDNGLRFALDKNMAGVDRLEETTTLVTRLYPYGRDSLEISNINGGIAYIDSPNISGYNRVYEGSIDYRDAETPEELLRRAKREFSPDNFNRIDVPQLSYKCGIVDLWKLGGRNMTKPELGDYATVFDKSLGIDVRLRVTEHDYYPYEPQKSAVTLGNPPKSAIDVLAQLSGQLDYYYSPKVPEFDVNIGETTIENITSKVKESFGDVIHEVVHNDVLVSDTAMLMNAWIKYLAVEFLETNFDALDARLPPPPNMERNFIRIQGQNLEFLRSELSNEPCGPDNPTANVENYKTPAGDQIYWTAVDDHHQACKYFTITDPATLPATKGYCDEEKEELRERFRVKVRRAIKTEKRMVLEFDQNHPYKIPRMTWGGGDEAGNGKGFIYKEGDGMYVTYTTREPAGDMPAGSEIGLKITDKGCWYFDVEAAEWMLVGSGGEGLLGGGHVILDVEANAMPQQPNLQFAGAVTVDDIPNEGITRVTITGGESQYNLLVLDHPPTKTEVESWPDDTLVFEYGPNDYFIPS